MILQFLNTKILVQNTIFQLYIMCQAHATFTHVIISIRFMDIDVVFFFLRYRRLVQNRNIIS